MLRVLGAKTQSDATDSYVPSNARPTSSPFAFNVAEPELPFVMCRSLKKSTGTSPSDGTANGDLWLLFATSSTVAGGSNGGFPVDFATICCTVVKAPRLAPGSPAGARLTVP